MLEPEYKEKLLDMIQSDSWSMKVLHCVKSLDLPDWAIGAGFVRAMVWDQLSGQTRTALEDVDVLYFDPDNLSIDREKQLEHLLRSIFPEIPWSVKNQARMHIRNKNAPYKNTEDAMRYWLETPTAVAVQLLETDEITILAPFGLADLFKMIIRPTPMGKQKMDQFDQRISEKPWLGTWPDVTVIRS